MCFAKHTLGSKQIRSVGPEAQTQPGHWYKLTRDPGGHCARMRELFTHALHSDKVIIFLRGGKTKAYMCSWERN
jgi:hypothetical protein